MSAVLCWLALMGVFSQSWAQGGTKEQLYLLGTKAYKDGLWDLAIQQFSQYLSLYPENSAAAEARFMQAEALFQKQQYRSAATLYQEFSQLHTNHELLDKALYRLGVCNYKLGDFQAAETAYRQLEQFSLSPLRDRAMLGLAESQYAQSKYKLAQESYQRIVEQLPHHTYRDSALYGLGWSSLKLGDYNKVIASLRQLVADFPDSALYAEALFPLAHAYYKLKNYQKAAAAFADFIKINPTHKRLNQALFYGGYAYYRAGSYSKAITFFHQSLKQPQPYAAAEARFQLGESQYKLGRYQLALGSYQQFLAAYPNNKLTPTATYNIGLCYFKLNQQPKGEGVFEQFVIKYPKHDLAPMAWLELGRLRFEQKKYTEATQAYTKAALSADKKTAAEARYWLAECLAQQGQLDRALKEFLKLLQEYADQTQWVNPARYQAAQIYVRQQKKLEAKKLFLKVIQESTDTKLAQLAREGLQELLNVSSN